MKPDGLGGFIEQVISASDLVAGGSASQPPVLLQSVTGNISYSELEITFIKQITFKTISGTPTVQVGVTLGGSEIMPATGVNVFLQVNSEYPFLADGSLYFIVTGGVVNIRIDQINNFI
jgi:hypothetical protein